MAFEEFQRKRSRVGEPAISISKFGNFIINSTVVANYFDGGGKKYVKLYWDEAERKIGIKPMASKDASTYAINFGPISPTGGGVGSFSGTAFLKAHGIKYDETKSFDAVWNQKEGLLVLKMD
jgi:hypothetical protein